MDDMRERHVVGVERYGTPLQAFNGRKALVDAYQECLDLAVYLRQEIEERAELDARLESLMNKLHVVHAVDLRYAEDIEDVKKVAPLPDLQLLRKFADGTGGRRTGDLMERGWLKIEVTEAGHQALKDADA